MCGTQLTYTHTHARTHFTGQLYDNFTTWIVENGRQNGARTHQNTGRHARKPTISISSTATAMAHSTRHKPHWMHFIACCRKCSPNELSYSAAVSAGKFYIVAMDEILGCTTNGNQSYHFYYLWPGASAHRKARSHACIHMPCRCSTMILWIFRIYKYCHRNFDKTVESIRTEKLNSKPSSFFDN